MLALTGAELLGVGGGGRSWCWRCSAETRGEAEVPPALRTAVGEVQTLMPVTQVWCCPGGAGTDGEAVLPWGW